MTIQQFVLTASNLELIVLSTFAHIICAGIKIFSKLWVQSTSLRQQEPHSVLVLTRLAGGDVGGRAISTAHCIDNCDNHLIVGERSKVSHNKSIVEAHVKDKSGGGIDEGNLVILEWSVLLCGTLP